jgi:hypothetical protein
MALRMNGSSSSRHGGRACAIEILLRKRPDLAAAEIETEQTQRYVVEILPLLDNVEWQEKDGPQIEDQTVQ